MSDSIMEEVAFDGIKSTIGSMYERKSCLITKHTDSYKHLGCQQKNIQPGTPGTWAWPGKCVPSGSALSGRKTGHSVTNK